MMIPRSTPLDSYTISLMALEKHNLGEDALISVGFQFLFYIHNQRLDELSDTLNTAIDIREACLDAGDLTAAEAVHRVIKEIKKKRIEVHDEYSLQYKQLPERVREHLKEHEKEEQKPSS